MNATLLFRFPCWPFSFPSSIFAPIPCTALQPKLGRPRTSWFPMKSAYSSVSCTVATPYNSGRDPSSHVRPPLFVSSTLQPQPSLPLESILPSMTSSNPVDPHWLDANGDEPIAIIGVACRFSGTASDEDGLWQLLSKGRTSWASNARNRFRMESFWHPQAHLPGSVREQ
jgi:hypothetical protein